jgi:hypothetical protein
MSTRTKIGKILLPVLASLLLIGIVSSEFPELLSLTDNTANDFAVLKVNTVVSRTLPAAGRPFRFADIDSSHPGSTLHSSALITFEKAARIPQNFSFFTPSSEHSADRLLGPAREATGHDSHKKKTLRGGHLWIAYLYTEKVHDS